MSRHAVNPSRLLRASVAVSCLALAAACTSEPAEKESTPSEPEVQFESGVGFASAVVHPQLAATGEDAQPSSEASYVVDVALEKAKAGQELELSAKDGDEWVVASTAETNGKGKASLTAPGDAEDIRVLTTTEEPLGVELSTAEAGREAFVDEMDEDEGNWGTRDQGYVGVRQCSRASDDAREWVDGVLRLSVIDDPDKGKCTVKGEQYDYRLNGHVGTAYSFTYGYAAARVKFQELRGQHGAFWMQSLSIGAPGSAKQSGAEIDVIEYFGDDHPQGGLTSFIYWPNNGNPQKAGGWVEKPEKYGEGWADQYHVFSVEWTPKKYVFRIDGQVTNTITKGVSGQAEYLIVSLLSSDYELKQLPSEDDLPQHMDVDWVRVWSLPGA